MGRDTRDTAPCSAPTTESAPFPLAVLSPPRLPPHTLIRPAAHRLASPPETSAAPPGTPPPPPPPPRPPPPPALSPPFPGFPLAPPVSHHCVDGAPPSRAPP